MSSDNKNNVVHYIDYRHWLQREYLKRARNNPRYSLRAFAKILGMDASSISQIISGKRKISAKVLGKICDAIGVQFEMRQLILQSLNVNKTLPIYIETPIFESIPLENFSAMADWYHAGILELTLLKNFQVRPESVARMLGISKAEAAGGIERLKTLGLIEERDGVLIKKEFFVSNESSPGVTSLAHKEFQRQLITKALMAIDETDPEEKDITSIVMSIDPKKIPVARQMIKKFRRDLCAFLEQGDRLQVYNIGIQLHPLSSCLESSENAGRVHEQGL